MTRLVLKIIGWTAVLNLIQVQTQNIAEGMYFNTSDFLNNSKLSKDPSVVSFTPICEINKMIPLAKIGHKSQFINNYASKFTRQYLY